MDCFGIRRPVIGALSSLRFSSRISVITAPKCMGQSNIGNQVKMNRIKRKIGILEVSILSVLAYKKRNITSAPNTTCRSKTDDIPSSRSRAITNTVHGSSTTEGLSSCSALTRPRLGSSIDSHRQSSHTLADLDQGYSNALSGLGNRHHTQDGG